MKKLSKNTTLSVYRTMIVYAQYSMQHATSVTPFTVNNHVSAVHIFLVTPQSSSPNFELCKRMLLFVCAHHLVVSYTNQSQMDFISA